MTGAKLIVIFYMLYVIELCYLFYVITNGNENEWHGTAFLFLSIARAIRHKAFSTENHFP